MADQTEPTPPPPNTLDLSVIIPVFNEAENVGPLCDEIHHTLSPLGIDFEIIFADDGSTDETPRLLADLSRSLPRVRVVTLRRNSGQTAALSAAIDCARGQVLVPMDGDLQNDPADIPRLLEKIREGYDVVSGWRQVRQDSWLSRRIPSRVANRLIAWLSGMPLHDFGCTLKAYRREVLAGVRLYGEMHRFIPIYASWQGASVVEIPINHRRRTHGRSKYGLGRTVRVMLDLVTIRFLERYSQRPMHLFGGFGIVFLLLAFIAFTVATFFKMIKLGGEQWFGADFVHKFGKDFVETPLPVLVALFGVTAIVSILMGLLAEMVMRTYFESQNKRTYAVRDPQGDDRR